MSHHSNAQSKSIIQGGYLSSVPQHIDYRVTNPNENLSKRNPETNTDFNESITYENCKQNSTSYDKKLKVEGFSGFNQSNVVNNYVSGVVGEQNNTHQPNIPLSFAQPNGKNQVLERINPGPPGFQSNFMNNPLNFPKTGGNAVNNNIRQTSFEQNQSKNKNTADFLLGAGNNNITLDNQLRNVLHIKPNLVRPEHTNESFESYKTYNNKDLTDKYDNIPMIDLSVQKKIIKHHLSLKEIAHDSENAATNQRVLDELLKDDDIADEFKDANWAIKNDTRVYLANTEFNNRLHSLQKDFHPVKTKQTAEIDKFNDMLVYDNYKGQELEYYKQLENYDNREMNESNNHMMNTYKNHNYINAQEYTDKRWTEDDFTKKMKAANKKDQGKIDTIDKILDNFPVVQKMNKQEIDKTLEHLAIGIFNTEEQWIRNMMRRAGHALHCGDNDMFWKILNDIKLEILTPKHRGLSTLDHYAQKIINDVKPENNLSNLPRVFIKYDRENGTTAHENANDILEEQPEVGELPNVYVDPTLEARINFAKQNNIIMTQEFRINEPIKKPYDYLQKCKDDPIIKVAAAKIPFNQYYRIVDISLILSGKDEEKAYQDNAGLRTNIKKGNCIVESLSRQDPGVYMARRGGNKILELHKNYITINLKNKDNEMDQENSSGTLEKYDQKMKDHIFERIQDFYKKNLGTVTLYNTTKANGANAQISFCEKVNAWAIGSKDITIMVRARSDISGYRKERYQYCRSIAHTWFHILDQLDFETQFQFKSQMVGITLIGEYVGDQRCQGMVKYTKISLVFFNVVNNISDIDKDYWTMEKGFEFMKKYGQIPSAHQKYMNIPNFMLLNKKQLDLYEQCGKQSLENGEEGKVIYFVLKHFDGKEILASVAKMQSMEFRIFHHLKQKLMDYVTNQNANRKQYLSFFTTECINLMGDCVLQKPFTWYMEITNKAFDFADQFPKQRYLISEAFITFQSITIYCSEKKIDVLPIMFQKENIEILMSTPWSQYKSMNLVIGEKALIEDLKKLNVTEVITDYRPKIYVFLPVTLPGVGKTYFVDNVLRPYCAVNEMGLQILSPDEIRRTCMNEFALTKQAKGMTYEKIFDKTLRDSNRIFNEKLISMIKKTQGQKNIIFIDKNHYPNNYKKSINQVRGCAPKGYKIEVIALIAKINSNEGYQINVSDENINSTWQFMSRKVQNNFKYPFKLNCFFKCLERVLKREESDHPTFYGNTDISFNKMVMAWNHFRNENIDEMELIQNGFDTIFSVDFFNMEEIMYWPSFEFTEKLSEILWTSKVGELSKNTEIIKELFKELKPIWQASTGYYASTSPIQLESQLNNFLNDTYFTKENNQLSLSENLPQKFITNTCMIIDGDSLKPNSKPITLNEIIETNIQEYSNEIVIEKHDDISGIQIEKTQDEIKKGILENEIAKATKLPLFLGLYCKDVDIKNSIFQLLAQTLDRIKDQYKRILNDPSDNKTIKELNTITKDLAEFDSKWLIKWKLPQEFYIETLYIGNNWKKFKEENFQSFIENFGMPLHITHLVYIPEGILFGLPGNNLFEKIKVEDKYPYICFIYNKQNGYEPKDCKKILQSMFCQENTGFKGFLDDEGRQSFDYNFSVRHSVTLISDEESQETVNKNKFLVGERFDKSSSKKKTVPIYLIKLRDTFCMDAETRKFYQ